MKEIILICGGRDFKDWGFFIQCMQLARPWFATEFCILQGGARGADRLAMTWAIQNGHAHMAMPANWFFYDKGAGAVRNLWMLKFGRPDLVIAFPGGTGTANMVGLARNAGIDVWIPDYAPF